MEKELKKYLKRKIKISLAVVVSFLITGSISLSSVLSSNDIIIENDKLILGQAINEKTDENTTAEERGNGIVFRVNEANPTQMSITNSGIIKGNLESSKFDNDDTNYSSFLTSGWGNGISNEILTEGSTLDNTFILNNSGMVSGNFQSEIISSVAFPSGNGISFYRGMIYRVKSQLINGEINNKGVILGNYYLEKGEPYPMINPPLGFGYGSSGSGNGIIYYLQYDNEKPDSSVEIDNIGLIKGNVNVFSNYKMYNGNGILAMNLNNLNNSGQIKGNSFLRNQEESIGTVGNGNGLVGLKFYNFNLNNNGLILGKSIAGNVYSSDVEKDYSVMYDGNGSGITYLGYTPGVEYQSYNRKMEMNIKNSGMIKGYYAGDRVFNTQDNDGNENKFTESRFAKHDGSGINYMSELQENNISIKNSGLISGNTDKEFGNGITFFITHAGKQIEPDGLYDIKANLNTINSGVILGKDSAIYLDRANVNKDEWVEGNNPWEGEWVEVENTDIHLDIKNYGILAGKNLVYVNEEENTNNPHSNKLTDEEIKAYVGQGLGVKLDDNTNVTEVVVGNGGVITDEGDLKGYEIKNVLTQEEANNQKFDKTLLSSTLDKTDKIIINGVNKGLEVDGDLELSNSILNSYGVALTVDSNSNFTGKGTIVNGGGLRGDTEDTTKKDIVVEGKENSALNFTEKTIINGDIAFTETTTNSNNSVVISDSSLNGNLYGSN